MELDVGLQDFVLLLQDAEVIWVDLYLILIQCFNLAIILGQTCCHFHLKGVFGLFVDFDGFFLELRAILSVDLKRGV